MKKYEWKLNALLHGDNDAGAQSKREKNENAVLDFVKKWKANDNYLNEPETLKQALDEYENLKHVYWPDGDEAFYFYLRSEQEENNSDIRAKANNANDFALKLLNDLEFFTINLSKINKNKQTDFLTYTGLSPYKHFLERIFAQSEHVLSENEEKILNLKNTVAYENWVKMTSSLLSQEDANIAQPDGTMRNESFSSLISVMRSTDKSIRDQAAKEFNKILAKYGDIAEAELNSVLKDKQINDDLRHFPYPESSRLLSDDIDKEIVDQMIKVVSDNFQISRDYYKLKAKLHGVKKLAYHERNIEYGQISKKYPFEEATKIVLNVFGNLDPKFKQITELFLENSQIDVFPRKGKRSGAFCAGNLISEPTYILLNHNNTLTDVTTLAHEVGHGINDELMKRSQNALNFGNSLAVAEFASTFMEGFVLDELEKEATSKEEKMTILINRLDEDISTIFRQVACYQFEQELHKQFRAKGYLSKEETGKLFQKYMAAYMGDFIEQSPGSENWWIYWNHIRSYFYNYSYANGLLIAKALQSLVKTDHQNINKIKNILSAGLSESPRQIFLNEGINISSRNFWQQGIDEIKATLEQAIALSEK